MKINNVPLSENQLFKFEIPKENMRNKSVSIIYPTLIGSAVGLLVNQTKALADEITAIPVTSGMINSTAWSHVFASVLGISDWLCVGVIIFAGATWMFGNRTKAIEMLIGGASGYLIIRHAKDIQEWLSSF